MSIIDYDSKRIERALSQRLFVLAKENDNKWIVKGSQKNIYDVLYDKNFICSCPAFEQRHKSCKHIYFIFYRVLKLPQHRRIDTNEIENALRKISLNNDFLAPQDLQIKYAEMISKLNHQVLRKEWKGQDCPICYEPMQEKEESVISYCTVQCGKSFHTSCFQEWIQHTPNKQTCVYCRANIPIKNNKRKRYLSFADEDNDGDDDDDNNQFSANFIVEDEEEEENPVEEEEEEEEEEDEEEEEEEDEKKEEEEEEEEENDDSIEREDEEEEEIEEKEEEEGGEQKEEDEIEEEEAKEKNDVEYDE